MMGLTSSNGRGAMPRDMSFPVPKGCSWHDLYDYIRYAYFVLNSFNGSFFVAPLQDIKHDYNGVYLRQGIFLDLVTIGIKIFT